MTRRLVRVTLCCVAGILLVSSAIAQEKSKPEHYAATWAVVGGSAGGSTIQLDIRINRFNTDQEIKNFADILVEGGQDALRRALEKEDVGQVSPTGRVGTQIAVARKKKSGGQTRIRVIVARNMSVAELRYSGRSVDYPYTILELIVDENGKGAGTAIGAAKIRFDKKKQVYEIESLKHGTAYNKLLNVYRYN